MARDPQGRFDLTRISQQLGGEGYVVLEGLLDSSRLTEWRGLIDRLAAEERQSPFLPGDGPVHPCATSPTLHALRLRAGRVDSASGR